MALSFVQTCLLQVSKLSFCNRCFSYLNSQKSSFLGRNLFLIQNPRHSFPYQVAFLRAPVKLVQQQIPATQEVVSEDGKEDKQLTKEVISKVNQQIEKKKHGRLFAVVHVCGKQFIITNEDLIVLEGHWAPTIGDKLKLDKVLLVGSADFTLFGRPILPLGLVSVEATVIEKRLSHTKTHFRKKKRQQYMRINFYRYPQTMLRITNISFTGKVNEKKDVEGLDNRIF